MKEFIEETTTGIYRITSEGEIFSQSKLKIPLVGKGMEFTGKFKEILKPERLLTQRLNNRGYLTVHIIKKTFMVHRLVLRAFLPNPLNKPFVNHKDANKLNNNLSNLEWCTSKENNAHARSLGLYPSTLGIPQNYKNTEIKKICLANLKDKSKLTPEQVRYVRTNHIPRNKEFSATALAKKFGTSVTAMCNIVKGKSYANTV